MNMTPTRPATRQTYRQLAVLAFAAAATFGLATAQGQVRVNTGNANDSNPQVGSGGLNRPAGGRTASGLQDNIIFGNVTGGRQFRGSLASTDPRAFRGVTSNVVGDFIRSSSGVTTGGVASFNANTVRPFFSEQRFVAPPQGFGRLPSVGGFVPVTPQSRLASDTRVGLDAADQIAAQAPVGVDGLPPSSINPNFFRDQADRPALQDPGGLRLNQQIDPALGRPSDFTNFGGTLPNGLTEDDVARMREELLGEAEGQTLGNGFEQPNNDALGGDLLEGLNQPRTPEGAPQLGGRLDVTDPVAAERIRRELQAGRDSQLGGLGDRLRTFREQSVLGSKQRENDVVNRVLNEQQAETEGADEPGVGGAGTLPPATSGNAEPADGAGAEPSVMPEAPTIRDLGGGVQNRSLKAVFESGREALLEGRYSDAEDFYATARRIDETSAFADYGRATALLGGGFYRRAADAYRSSFERDPALLMARFDLVNMLGEARVDELMDELKDRVRDGNGQPAEPFLLALLHYNTGNDRLARGFLDLAAQRDSDEPFYEQIGEAWQVGELENQGK